MHRRCTTPRPLFLPFGACMRVYGGMREHPVGPSRRPRTYPSVPAYDVPVPTTWGDDERALLLILFVPPRIHGGISGVPCQCQTAHALCTRSPRTGERLSEEPQANNGNVCSTMRAVGVWGLNDQSSAVPSMQITTQRMDGSSWVHVSASYFYLCMMSTVVCAGFRRWER